MMEPSYSHEEARATKFKAVLGDHIPKNELKRLKASLEAMDLSPDYQDHYYDGLGGDVTNQELTQRLHENS